jgi:hypothetical protein
MQPVPAQPISEHNQARCLDSIDRALKTCAESLGYLVKPGVEKADLIGKILRNGLVEQAFEYLTGEKHDRQVRLYRHGSLRSLRVSAMMNARFAAS